MANPQFDRAARRIVLLLVLVAAWWIIDTVHGICVLAQYGFVGKSIIYPFLSSNPPSGAEYIVGLFGGAFLAYFAVGSALLLQKEINNVSVSFAVINLGLMVGFMVVWTLEHWIKVNPRADQFFLSEAAVATMAIVEWRLASWMNVRYGLPRTPAHIWARQAPAIWGFLFTTVIYLVLGNIGEFVFRPGQRIESTWVALAVMVLPILAGITFYFVARLIMKRRAPEYFLDYDGKAWWLK